MKKETFQKNSMEPISPERRYERKMLISALVAAAGTAMLFLSGRWAPAAVPVIGGAATFFLWSLAARFVFCRDKKQLLNSGVANAVGLSLAIPVWVLISGAIMRTAAPLLTALTAESPEIQVFTVVFILMGSMTGEALVIPFSIMMGIQHIKGLPEDEKPLYRYLPLAAALLNTALAAGTLYLLYSNK